MNLSEKLSFITTAWHGEQVLQNLQVLVLTIYNPVAIEVTPV